MNKSARKPRAGILGLTLEFYEQASPGMGDFAVDTTDLVATFGCLMAQLPFGDYIRRAEEAAQSEVDALVNCYRDSFDVADDVGVEDLHAAGPSGR